MLDSEELKTKRPASFKNRKAWNTYDNDDSDVSVAEGKSITDLNPRERYSKAKKSVANQHPLNDEDTKAMRLLQMRAWNQELKEGADSNAPSERKKINLLFKLKKKVALAERALE